jgi:hypothetical protein
MKTVVKRMKKKTPPFFKKVRNVGLAIAGVGAALIGAPIALPAIVLNIAGYMIATGTVASAVSQAAEVNE